MFYFFLLLSIVFVAIALRWYVSPNAFGQFIILTMLAVFSFGVAVGTLIK